MNGLSFSKTMVLGRVDHGIGNRLPVAQTNQLRRQRQFLLPAIITLDPRRRPSDARRQVIIAVNARNLLDQVHLALYVHPPRRRLDVPVPTIIALYFKAE